MPPMHDAALEADLRAIRSLAAGDDVAPRGRRKPAPDLRRRYRGLWLRVEMDPETGGAVHPAAPVAP